MLWLVALIIVILMIVFLFVGINLGGLLLMFVDFAVVCFFGFGFVKCFFCWWVFFCVWILFLLLCCLLFDFGLVMYICLILVALLDGSGLGSLVWVCFGLLSFGLICALFTIAGVLALN